MMRKIKSKAYNRIASWLDGLDEFTGSLFYWWAIFGKDFRDSDRKHFWKLLDNRPVEDRNV
jgi:hypothetical protein